MVVRGYRNLIYNCYRLLTSHYKCYCEGNMSDGCYLYVKERILQNLIGFYATVRQKQILIRKSRCVKAVKKFYDIGVITLEEYEEQIKEILKK